MNAPRLIAIAGTAALLLGAAPQQSQAFFGWCWRSNCCYRPVCYRPCYRPCCPTPCAPACGPACGPTGCGPAGCGVTPTFGAPYGGGSPCGPGGCGVSYRTPASSMATFAAARPASRPRLVYRPEFIQPAPPRAVQVKQTRPVTRQQMTTVTQRRVGKKLDNAGWVPVSTQRVIARH